ncbi:DUF6223 family protein [Paractinoplanes atraurantiacus]|uniref:Uncharacterized protein n=1 Tax=Paractinoplanes atraurantiacus TaxID=1036182 RepID=A0A285IM35_9ACTN|nr:DUF6223 family protein [Actinoplanes atraurantiacus]SNY48797.1 hypothetical protein SAMN05421748_109115 [Actinoplanes atraurantiacus]
MTADRLIATVAALLALAGVIAGIRALTRPARLLPLSAVAAGLAGTFTGILVVATADGGPGTGNGVVGGWAALALGPIAAGLGGVALLRSLRSKGIT